MKPLRLLAPAFAIVLIGCGNTAAPGSDSTTTASPQMASRLTASNNGRLDGLVLQRRPPAALRLRRAAAKTCTST